MIPRSGDGGPRLPRVASKRVTPAPSTPELPGDMDVERIARAIYEASTPPGNRPAYAWDAMPDVMRAFWLRRAVAAASVVWETAYAAAERALLDEPALRP
jgi:hypothetical protein